MNIMVEELAVYNVNIMMEELLVYHMNMTLKELVVYYVNILKEGLMVDHMNVMAMCKDRFINQLLLNYKYSIRNGGRTLHVDLVVD